MESTRRIHELRRETERLKREESQGCTGVSAMWCPVHGNCTCNDDAAPEELEASNVVGDLNHPGCPLHGEGSTHAEAELQRLERQRRTQ
jgi:hypothetical protein